MTCPKSNITEREYILIQREGQVAPLVEILFSNGWKCGNNSAETFTKYCAWSFSQTSQPYAIFLNSFMQLSPMWRDRLLNSSMQGQISHGEVESRHADFTVLKAEDVLFYIPKVGDRVRLTQEIKDYFNGDGNHSYNDEVFTILKVEAEKDGFWKCITDKCVLPSWDTKILQISNVNKWGNRWQLFELVNSTVETIWNSTCLICGSEALDLVFAVECSNNNCQNRRRG
jgi:hypothetical protein